MVSLKIFSLRSEASFIRYAIAKRWHYRSPFAKFADATYRVATFRTTRTAEQHF